MKRLNQNDSIGVQDWERLMWDWICLDELSSVFNLLSSIEHSEVKGQEL